MYRMLIISALVAGVIAPSRGTDASPSTPPTQAMLERDFDAAIKADEMRGWLQRMSSEPNQVGSAHNKANAEWELAQFKYWGWDAHIEKFEVFYPTPISESAGTCRAATLQSNAAGAANHGRHQRDGQRSWAARLSRFPGRWRCHGATSST